MCSEDAVGAEHLHICRKFKMQNPKVHNTVIFSDDKLIYSCQFQLINRYYITVLRTLVLLLIISSTNMKVYCTCSSMMQTIL